MTLAIIPARGGSKGIRLKNIQPVAGQPLLAWTIRQAVESLLVSRVVVATDHNEIAKVAAEYGAEVFWRSPETATDTATTESAVSEVLEQLPGIEPDLLVVLLQATSPLRQPDDIDNAITLLRRTHCDSVFSARRVEGYTWQVGRQLSPPHQRRMPRQQQAESTIEENGSIYVFRQETFRQHGDRICGEVRPYLMHPLDSFQIDEPADIPLLEQLITLRAGHGHHATATR
jgi:CMP-N,N'-diacetyllegionaminic acid synthase